MFMNHPISFNPYGFMKAFIFFVPLIFLMVGCAVNQANESEEPQSGIDYDVEERLAELNIELGEPTPPVANYVKAVQAGDLVFLSGHGPDRPEGGLVTGKVGSDLTLEEGQDAARLTGISLLSSLKAEIGDLNRVRRVVKVTGMVNAEPDFTQHPQVINGFSDLMVEVFGEHGRHARAAVGMGSLPSNIAVEIDAVVEISAD
jgi:enamine deaminase RidA (YjgF/YER057c/UK114 family)